MKREPGELRFLLLTDVRSPTGTGDVAVEARSVAAVGPRILYRPTTDGPEKVVAGSVIHLHGGGMVEVHERPAHVIKALADVVRLEDAKEGPA